MVWLRVAVICFAVGCAEPQPVAVTALVANGPEVRPVGAYAPPRDWPPDCPAAGSVESEATYLRNCQRLEEEREKLRIAAAQGVANKRDIDWLKVARERCLPKSCPPDEVRGHCATEKHVPITFIPGNVVVQALTEKCISAPLSAP